MKQKLLLFIALFSTATALSQNNVTGKITGEDNLPVNKATITISQKSKISVVIANEDGYYEITGLPNGRYTLTVSAVGFENNTETVLLNNASIVLNFTLTTSSLQLQTVEVIGRSARKYNSDYSLGFARG